MSTISFLKDQELITTIGDRVVSDAVNPPSVSVQVINQNTLQTAECFQKYKLVQIRLGYLKSKDKASEKENDRLKCLVL
jgi:hypothetical protein